MVVISNYRIFVANQGHLGTCLKLAGGLGGRGGVENRGGSQFFETFKREGLQEGEQVWHSGESTCLPPMWCRVRSQTWCHLWVEFVGPTTLRDFPSPQKPKFDLI